LQYPSWFGAKVFFPQICEVGWLVIIHKMT
jgi:hypothetical protein